MGNAFSALISWLAVRQLNGAMVLRMEDLDPDRSKPHFAQQIIDDLHWLGLDWDEGPDVGGAFGPYSQSERRALYESCLEGLKAQGLIYPCYCTRNELRDASAPHPGEGEAPYTGRCRTLSPQDLAMLSAQRKPSLRLVTTADVIRFQDLNYGIQEQRINELCGDFIVRRSDGVHAYQLAVSVDDALMGINRVIRGADLLDSTFRQIYIHHLMGVDAPMYGHVPLLMGQDGERLSKRHRVMDLGQWRQLGVSPERLLGFLSWKAGLIDRLEAVSAKELVRIFSWTRMPRGPLGITAEEGGMLLG